MNLNTLRKFWLVLAILIGLLCPVLAQGEQFAQGDFDRDGDVDFADFLIFANNFGKPITQQTLAETTTDTVVVTVRDTITVTQDQTAGIKLGQMFGYWLVEYKITNPNGEAFGKEKNDAFLFHHTNGSDKNTVYGKSINHNIVAPFALPEKEAKVTYLPFEDTYTLTHKKHIGIKELTLYTTGSYTSKTGLHDLEIKFSIEHEIRDDMTKLLNNIPNLPPEWYKTISEPVVKIEYMRVFINTENRYVYLDAVNGGLRPCSRNEYMRLSEKW